MSQKKRQTIFEQLTFDEGLKCYRCQHPLAGKLIEVFIDVTDAAEPGTLQIVAKKTEALFDEWPTLRETVLKAAREKLVSFGRLEQGNESKVTLDSLVLDSVRVIHRSTVPPYFCFGISIPGMLDELESLDYTSDFDGTYEYTEISFMS